MKEKLMAEIQEQKQEQGAVILAHYYAPEEIQQVADYVGDSFYLARVAKQSAADVLVFCGVSFMGESAKILNPKKKVLMPDLTADCPMAHMVTVQKIEKMRAQYDDLAVVCYINSSAELKTQSDVCVTSSNAVRIVKSLPNQNIFFIPDQNLGRFVAQQVPEKNVILNDGCCPIHAALCEKDVLAEKQRHPDALVIAHPECSEDVLAVSDYIGSTLELIAYANNSSCEEFIVCTEQGVEYKLAQDQPHKKFYFPKSLPCCDGMKCNTLEKLLHVLQTGENEIEVCDCLREAALKPLEKMLELAR